MTETAQETQVAEQPRLYSANMIFVGTFMGGPLVAGIMVRKNFINLGREKEGMAALAIGIVATALLLNSMLLSPEGLIDRLPRYLIPTINTLVVALLVHWKLGSTLSNHKKMNGPVYSNWHTFGYSLAGAVLFFLLALSADLLIPSDQHIYEEKLAEFSANEEKALRLYEMESASAEEIVKFIDETGLPAWRKSLDLLAQSDSLPALSTDALYHNSLLRRYCDLRIECYTLIKKSYAENTNLYDQQINDVNANIEEVLGKMQ
jgi:hypothetical protein